MHVEGVVSQVRTRLGYVSVMLYVKFCDLKAVYKIPVPSSMPREKYNVQERGCVYFSLGVEGSWKRLLGGL